ncbi:MAG: hypothetical protein ACREQ4_10400 [Candidatus Binataceae bacterium]
MKTEKDKQSTPTPFERFERLIRGLVAVPKKEIEAEQERWREERKLKKKRAHG